ncbi:MAG: Raf kinase inhibitor-like YbhB/YbcL family protein [Rickettsiales bacterium]|jgi:Raf kinase inhibitor-like YbhB/YbcL family protein
MNKILVSLIFLFVLPNLANAQMTISSPDFKEGETISNLNVFNGFGCFGENVFPKIDIKNIPKTAKSLAITIHDPDAPTGSGWWHWLAYNIPSSIGSSDYADAKIYKMKDFTDKALFGKNDYGTFGYGGPCPPKGHGEHRYVLTVYALSVSKLSVPAAASSAMIGYNLNANMIEKSSITSLYQR